MEMQADISFPPAKYFMYFVFPKQYYESIKILSKIMSTSNVAFTGGKKLQNLILKLKVSRSKGMKPICLQLSLYC